MRYVIVIFAFACAIIWDISFNDGHFSQKAVTELRQITAKAL